MKRILVTGATGFIGSHLTELLVEQGYSVKTFVHYNSRNSWGWLENSKIKNEIEIVVGDIRDFDSVCNALRNCYAVFHLAALIGIPYSYVSPKAYIETNINGTYNVLQASKELGIEQVLITSTSETYGTAQYIPIDEKHPMVGQSPYSASKIAADQLALSYYRSFGVPVKIVRPFNTYGPRQSARAIVPTIITQILDGAMVIKLGNVSTCRDLTYVKDTAMGFIEIFKSAKTIGEEINIATQSEISIECLTKLIMKIMNKHCDINVVEVRLRPENSEVRRLLGANTKILQLTNWEKHINIEDGLQLTVDWFTNADNFSKYKPKIYNI
jgi:NAD dependent epimerase/dehydratase